MPKTTLHTLAEHQQSVWLDYISRKILDNGHLTSLIDQGLLGLTSNPSIFNQAISQSDDYDQEIIRLGKEGATAFNIYDKLTIKDIQDAADHFKGIYDQTSGLDGYVSLEINPLLAQKVEEQAAEGKRLFKEVDRPNVMIKVPATEQGLLVVEELIAEGINVNVTLIFSLDQYRKTANAYLKGLNKLSQTSKDISHVRSVASVFISRIDAKVDQQLEDRLANESGLVKDKVRHLLGKAAVANAQRIYSDFKQFFKTDDFQQLKKKGAHIQRVLWGSTSTKNPEYSDIKYVTELIAADTVNTLPEKTLVAFLDHGQVSPALTEDDSEAQNIISQLKEYGIDIDVVCSELLEDGCRSFDSAFESLLSSVKEKADQLSLQSS